MVPLIVLSNLNVLLELNHDEKERSIDLVTPLKAL